MLQTFFINDSFSLSRVRAILSYGKARNKNTVIFPNPVGKEALFIYSKGVPSLGIIKKIKKPPTWVRTNQFPDMSFCSKHKSTFDTIIWGKITDVGFIGEGIMHYYEATFIIPPASEMFDQLAARGVFPANGLPSHITHRKDVRITHFNEKVGLFTINNLDTLSSLTHFPFDGFSFYPEQFTTDPLARGRIA